MFQKVKYYYTWVVIYLIQNQMKLLINLIDQIFGLIVVNIYKNFLILLQFFGDIHIIPIVILFILHLNKIVFFTYINNILSSNQFLILILQCLSKVDGNNF